MLLNPIYTLLFYKISVESHESQTLIHPTSNPAEDAPTIAPINLWEFQSDWPSHLQVTKCRKLTLPPHPLLYLRRLDKLIVFNGSNKFHRWHDNNVSAARTVKTTYLNMDRAWLKGGPQIAWMLQAKPGRSGKQPQEQNSPNLGTGF